MYKIEYSNNEGVENSLNEVIKKIINDLANLSFTCLLKETHLTYKECINIEESKKLIIQTMMPVVISGLKSENKYNLDYVVNHIFLDKFSIFDNTEILKIKIRLENIHIDNLYSLFYHTSETILYFFELIDSNNNIITNADKKEQKLLTFTNLFSILLEIYFSNNQQLSNLNVNALKELINNISNNLNNKIINNKDIINLVSLLSNVNCKCETEILKYFNIELTEKITQLTNLNLAKLKTIDKNTNKTIVDKNILKDIKNTLATFIKTSTITFIVIEAIVYIISLIAEKIPMLSSMISKSSNMISNTINSISSGINNINLFSGNDAKGTKNKLLSKTNLNHENTAIDTKETTKDHHSENRSRKNNKDTTNNSLGNNGNISNNPDLGKDKSNIPNGDGSITITPPSGTNGRIGNSSDPLIPMQDSNRNKSNKKRSVKTADLEPENDITGNSQTTITDNSEIKDATVDNTENNETQKNKEINNNSIFSDISSYDEFNEFRANDDYNVEIDNEQSTENNNYLQNKIKQQEENKTSNPSKNNSTPTQPSTDTDNITDINNTDNTNNIDDKTDNNKHPSNDLPNTKDNNKLTPEPSSTSFQDKLKKENKNNESVIEKEKKKHEENENKSHTEIIETKKTEKGDDSPDNSPSLR